MEMLAKHPASLALFSELSFLSGAKKTNICQLQSTLTQSVNFASWTEAGMNKSDIMIID